MKQEPKSGTRMGTKWEQEPKIGHKNEKEVVLEQEWEQEWEQSGNKNPRGGEEWEQSGNKNLKVGQEWDHSWSGKGLDTKWEQEPQSGTRMRQEWEQRLIWDKNPNKVGKRD